MKHAILFAILSALSAWGNAQTSGVKGEEVICVDRTGEVKDIAEAMRRVERLRKADARRSVAVEVSSGDWTVPEEVRIGKSHARSDWGCLSIRPCSGAKVRLFGGHEISSWKRTAFNGRGDVWSADVSALKLKRPLRTLFLDGKRLDNARHPNAVPGDRLGGWAHVAADSDRKDSFRVGEADWRGWKMPEEGGVLIIPRYNWFSFMPRITGVTATNRTISLASELWYKPAEGDRYFVWGHAEDLDAPGEWYHDFRAAKLYLIPPDGCDPNANSIHAPVSGSVFRFTGAANAEVKGFEILAAESGVTGESCDGVDVVSCRIHDVGSFGGDGVSFARSRRCRVIGCEIWNIGRNGVILGGGTPDTLDESGNEVYGCEIRNTGVVNRHGNGIQLDGQGGRAICNHVSDTPRYGICPHGRIHLVASNRIERTNLETEDCGAIYTGGYSAVGTRIVDNWISESVGRARRNGKWTSPCFARGIHLDEAIGNVTVTGNIVENSSQGSMCLHSARFVTISNNLFISNAREGGNSPQIDFHGWTDATNSLYLRSRRPAILKGRERLVSANPAWAERYPAVSRHPDELFVNGHMMRDVKVTDNVFYYPDQPSSPLMWAVNFETNRNNNVFIRNTIADTPPDRSQWPAFHAGVPASISARMKGQK